MSLSPEAQESFYLLHCCAEIMGGPQLNEHQMTVYLNSLDTKDGKAVVAALRHWLGHERRFPVPADIRQLIEQAKEGEAA